MGTQLASSWELEVTRHALQRREAAAAYYTLGAVTKAACACAREGHGTLLTLVLSKRDNRLRLIQLSRTP